MSREVIVGAKARERIMHGIDVISDAVKITLGPKGRNVIMESPYGPPRVSKDGISVAREISLADRFENLGVVTIQEVAARTSEQVGDGTTTATVLAQMIAREGIKAAAAGMNPMDLKRGLDLAAAQVAEELKRRAVPVASREEIERVAFVSANGDTMVARLIANAMERVGRSGTIVVEEARGVETEVEVLEGLRLEGGYLSPYFITDAEKLRGILDEPLILLYDGKLAAVQPLKPLLDEVAQVQRPLLVIADEIEGECLATLVLNKIRGTLHSAAVKTPGFGEARKALLDDVAAVTGGGVVSAERGETLETVRLKSLGSARRVEIGRDSTVVIGGGGHGEEIATRAALIRAEIDKAAKEPERNRLRRRLASLTGGIAILRVAGATEPEIKERRDRVEDALHATQAAVEEGILPGGGSALLHAGRVLDRLRGESPDQNAGIAILRKALQAPIRGILENAGANASIIIGRLLDEGRFESGFDAQENRFADMIEIGIVDPLKVVRTALQKAVSIAGLLITTEAAITESASGARV